jgi:hypothetical protein
MHKKLKIIYSYTEYYKNIQFHIQNIIVDQSKNDDRCESCLPSDDNCAAFIWLETGGERKEPTYNQRKDCQTQFVPLNQSSTSQVGIRIVNIGTTKVTIDGKVAVPGDWNKGVDINISNNSIITLPANDKYDPANNSYDGASYLFYMHQIGNPRQVFPCVGGMVQPIYKYQVGTEGQEKEYFLSSLIPREVGLGKGKCEAVNDFNSDNSNSLFGDLFNAWISVIGFFGLGAGLGYWLIPSVRDNINASLRRVFSNNPTSYNSEFRAKYENSWGVFINGYGYYIPVWNCSVNYFKKRGFLPYIGEETAEARKLDLNNVPYQGSSWRTDYETRLNQGASMLIFQPTPIKENNLKDKGNQPYFMEFREGDIQITYETGFL